MSEADLATAARPILDRHYQRVIEEARALYERRSSERRATEDISELARAATNGAIELLMVDIDSVLPGTVDESDGTVTFASAPGVSSYDVVDEIAGRAMMTGARCLGVRKEDIPGGAPLAAVLRYPI